MPKGSNGFKQNPERARLAGRKSSRALPIELKEARLMNANQFEQTIYKYMRSNLEQLSEVYKNAETPAIDLVVIKILKMAIESGDYQRLNFLLERTIGKVSDKLEVQGKIGILKLHDIIIRKLEGTGQESTS